MQTEGSGKTIINEPRREKTGLREFRPFLTGDRREARHCYLATVYWWGKARAGLDVRSGNTL